VTFVIRVTEAAKLDAMEEAGWYEICQSGLGTAFRSEVNATVSSLRDEALRHAIRFSDVLLKVTVFAIIYSARSPNWIRPPARTPRP
jgi:hypothetical protein